MQDGLGHAIWAARAERKFRPQIIVDKETTLALQKEISELKHKIGELSAKNRELYETLKSNIIELSTYKQWDESKIKFLPISEIAFIVCKYFKITKTDIISHSRGAAMVLPRHSAIYLCKRHTVKSYPEIARWFGGRDHTSCLHAFRKMELLRQNDTDIRGYLDNLEALIADRLREMRETTKLGTSHVMGAVADTPLSVAAPEDLK